MCLRELKEEQQNAIIRCDFERLKIINKIIFKIRDRKRQQEEQEKEQAREQRTAEKIDTICQMSL
ncbi:MAG: hypothetical protein EOL95_09400 [Bacteroidia bacterium]|nr:hypothetical protein [Bacteroidia bacterium]